MVPFTSAGPRARPSAGPRTRAAAARSWRGRAALAACVVFAGACATTVSHPDAPVFAGVRKVALVRGYERPPRAAARPKDPLDGLGESLGSRGIATRVVEIEAGGGEAARALERLEAEVEGHVRAASSGPDRRPELLGDGAAKVVQDLGVDALALYVRLGRPGSLARGTSAPPDSPPPTYPVPGGTPWPASTYRPVAALALVARDGRLVWIDWGPREEGVPGPVNAAEALDEAIRLLLGEPPPDGA